ncbi:MAG: ferrous iron transporter B, partial [Candidatus Margulisiibacteriota bacterium]
METRKVALVGNPNVGKSVVFSHLTGIYATVSNYPGTTVEVTRGAGLIAGEKFEVIDTPGMNSLIPSSEDEKVARDLLLDEHPDVIVQVADAKNMRRTLLLTLELMAMGFPLILDLNLMDEVQQRRIEIDLKKLEELLGIKIVATVATDGIGIWELKQAVKKAADARQIYKTKELPELPNEVRGRQRAAVGIYKASVKKNPHGTLFLERMGDLTMRPLTGFPVLLLVLWLMYQFVGVFAAQNGVAFMEGILFGKYINPWAIKLADIFIPFSLLKEFLVGEYGVVTMALSYALAIILPIVSAFFIFFSILEDSGYLPRLAILLNRSFRTIGLSGKAVIPMVLGLGCDTMATMVTRTLETKRERILATLLLALAIPCSAQLGVILGLIGGLSAKATLIWAGSVTIVFFLVGFLAAKVIPGKSSDFILEIPPIRVPKLKNILVKTLARIEWYLREAVPLFIIGTVFLFVLSKLSILKAIENLARPLVVSFLGLPAGAAEAFLIGFFRRDY